MRLETCYQIIYNKSRSARVLSAWGSERRKFYAVLEVPPVTSARDAVRAAIVVDHRSG
jgi:hypothetical protein